MSPQRKSFLNTTNPYPIIKKETHERYHLVNFNVKNRTSSLPPSFSCFFFFFFYFPFGKPVSVSKGKKKKKKESYQSESNFLHACTLHFVKRKTHLYPFLKTLRTGLFILCFKSSLAGRHKVVGEVTRKVVVVELNVDEVHGQRKLVCVQHAILVDVGELPHFPED